MSSKPSGTKGLKMPPSKVSLKELEVSDDNDEEETPLDDIEVGVPGLEDLTTLLVFGDIHFQTEAFVQGEEFIEKAIETARGISPSIIILLGDILHTHETSKFAPYKQAEKLIRGLMEIAPVYCLMGNHDLINCSQFLTDSHFFGPYKEWPRVTIVDTPVVVTVGDKNLVMCPYVPPGRFLEALGHLDFDWREADCIFAHQEFKGVMYNGKASSKGDKWQEDYPPVVSGHIHEGCKIGSNVYYTGSSRQVAFDELPDKRAWTITFETLVPNTRRDFDDGELLIDKIDLGLKTKKEIQMNYIDLKKFDFSEIEQHHIKLNVVGTRDQFKAFRKNPLYSKLLRNNVKVTFSPILEESVFVLTGTEDEGAVTTLTFDTVMKSLVLTKSLAIQQAYAEIFEALVPTPETGVEAENQIEFETVYELEFED